MNETISESSITENINLIKKLLAHNGHQTPEAFDKKLRALTIETFTLLAKIPPLLGDKSLGPKMETIGTAGYKISSIIAGLKGIGLQAGISPIAASVGLISGVTTVLNTFRAKQINTKPIIDALLLISDILHFLREEMHDQFKQVLKNLDVVSQDILIGFSEGENNHDIMQQKMALWQDSLLAFKNDDAYHHTTALSYLKELTADQKNSNLKHKYDEIALAADDAENYIIRSSSHFLKYTDKLNHLFSLLHSTIGCKSAELTGHEITANFVKQHPRQVNHLINAFVWPVLPIRTLSSYHQDVMSNQNTFYSKAQFDHIVKNLALSNKTCVSSTHGLAQLLLNSAEDISSLSNTIMTFVNTQDDTKQLLIPLLIQSDYSLLRITKNPLHINYYGDLAKCERLRLVIEELTKIVEVDHDPFTEPNDNIAMPSNLNKDNSALWILSLLQKLDGQPSQDIMPDSLDAQNKQYQAMLTTLPFHTNPINPVLWCAFTQRYINLLDRLYETQNPTNADIEQLQTLLEDAEQTQATIANMRQGQFFDYLIDQLSNACSQLKHELDQHFKIYEINQSQAINIAVSEALQHSQRKNLYKQLIDQRISIRADYPSAFTANVNLAVSHWGNNRTYQKLAIKHMFDGYHAGLYDYISPRPGSNVYSQKLAKAYVAQQAEQINQQVQHYIKENRLNKLLLHQNDLTIFGDHLSSNNTKSIPCAIYPLDADMPILFSHPEMTNFINDIYFTAQNLGLGEIKFEYGIDSSNNTFLLKTSFHCYQTKPAFPISIKTVPYESLFYDGKEAVWWFAVGGNCVLNPNELVRNGPYFANSGSHFMNYSYCPTLQDRIGLINRLPDMIEALDEQSKNNQTNEKLISQLIDDKRQSLQSQWRKQIQDIIINDDTSPLGKALAAYDIAYQLLIKFIELAYPIEQRQHLLNLLKAVLTNDNTWCFVGSCTDLHSLLTKDLSKPLSQYLPEDKDFKGLKYIVQWTLDACDLHPQMHLFTDVNNAIFAMIDKLMPKLKPAYTSNQPILPKNIDWLQQALMTWAAIDPQDVDAIKKMQTQMSMVLAPAHSASKVSPLSIFKKQDASKQNQPLVLDNDTEWQPLQKKV